jgi:hypothetical protein
MARIEKGWTHDLAIDAALPGPQPLRCDDTLVARGQTPF